MNRKTLTIAAALVFFIFGPRMGFAGEGTTGDYLGDIGSKFGRGFANILISPLEIPCAIGDDMGVHPETSFFTGFGRGALFMLRRILVGVCEVGTFMMPAGPTLPPVCKANSHKS